METSGTRSERAALKLFPVTWCLVACRDVRYCFSFVVTDCEREESSGGC